MHASTVSRIIVRIPVTDAEIREAQTDFFTIAAFSRVIGAIDGTHIPIESPGGEDAEVFRNRKGRFSIKVQVVCSATLKILDIVANWGGSTHDATIFNNSLLKRKFVDGDFPNCYLLDPQTPAESLYNVAHIRTRNCVERLFGVWKRRFPILACGMRVKLQTRLTIIVATAILHNIAIVEGEQNPPPAENMIDGNLEINIENAQIDGEPIDEGHNLTRALQT